MKKLSLVQTSRSRIPPTTTASGRFATGSHCPASGFWSPVDDPQTALFFHEGSLMPSHQGKHVHWIQQAHALGAIKINSKGHLEGAADPRRDGTALGR